MSSSILVPPDGPTPCEWAVVGEAPATHEVREGRGFVGPSGRMLWPLMLRLAELRRDECYVTNLCKHPLDNSLNGDAKLTEGQFDVCATRLVLELMDVRPKRILAVGALAAKALLGDRYTSMEVVNGVGFPFGDALVVPTWHPAAALRPGGADKIVYTGAAIAAFRDPFVHPQPPTVPPIGGWIEDEEYVGIDTEGVPDDPICMTLATSNRRVYVPASDVRDTWETLKARGHTLIYHNAPWDWGVLEAMGVHAPWTVPYRDTMELAYLRQVEPQGLKALAYRYLGLRVRSWEDVVMPHYTIALQTEAARRIMDGSTVQALSPKGRLLKKPTTVYSDEAKLLKRAFNNPELLAKRMPDFSKPSLRTVPEDEAVEYATLDPWVTMKLLEVLQ